MTDPTTPEGRAELRELFARGSARAVYSWAIAHGAALLAALDDAECEIERQRGDLVIERRRAEAAEAALDRVRDLCVTVDGDWINSDFLGNTVGDIRRALDGDS